MTTTQTTWTDPMGTPRTGELIDQASGTNAQGITATATVWFGGTSSFTTERFHLELYMHATQKTIERVLPDQAAAEKAMADFRRNTNQ